MNRYTLMTAAALAVGGMTYTGCDRDETVSSNNPSATTRDTAGDKVDRAMERTGDAVGTAVDKTVDATQDAGDKLANATDRAGDRLREGTRDATDSAQQAGARIGDRVDQGTAAAPDAEGIRDVLAIVTEAALTENGLDDLTERLGDADRNRIGDAIEADFPEHAALVKQFRADWKAKYNQEFDVKEAQAYPEAMFSIRQGEIGAAAPSGAEVATGQRAGDVDANRERGRNVAAVSIAASHGMPGLSVPLIHEAPDAWKIDAPDSLTAAKLRSNVVAHLKAAHAMKAQWPADVNQGYAAVTHHVLMAILDQPVQQK
jgi:hypothetical protein